MPRYVVLSRFTPEAMKTLHGDPELHELQRDVEALGGKVVEQHYLLGKHDVFTVVDLPDNEAGQGLSLSARATRTVLPAIDVSLFSRLMGQSAETTGPHRWQASWPACTARRALAPFIYGRPSRQKFQPFTVVDGHHFDGLQGPAIFVANHTSHLDGPALHAALPKRYQRKVAVAAAADRFYIKGRKGIRRQGWWFSLAWNMFPLKRSGGRAALEHAEWLIDRGMSIAIFPEGGRSNGHKLARFRVGPAMLAVSKQVPIVPMYLDGLKAIRPKGSRVETPGPVTVSIGAPISLPPGSDPFVATMSLQRTVEAMGRAASAQRHAASTALAQAGTEAAAAAPLTA
jgi:1-acyl-sn-glycerol-3-phosphate acyltransferase